MALRAIALSFGVTPQRGFLPPEDPLDQLPAPFNAWDEAAASIPSLLATQTVRSTLARLPLLDASQLTDERQLQLAAHELAYLTHAYLWCEGDAGVVHEIPSNLAVPLEAVTAQLGLPPVITHSKACLWNWAVIDNDHPDRLCADNLRVLHYVSDCGRDEEWFFVATAALEAIGAAAIAAIIDFYDQQASALSTLHRIRDTLQQMRTALMRLPEHCQPSVFYDQLRPFLAGSKGNPTLPSGLVYQHCFNNSPQHFSGASAAQSSLLQAIDIALRVHHAPQDPTETDADSFLAQMRHYMPKNHRLFLEALQAGPNIRECLTDKETTVAYKECVEALEQFRDGHIQIVALYIISQKHRVNKSQSLQAMGTGGTNLMGFLKHVRDETINAKHVE